MTENFKEYLGEFLGTCILVFFGCAAVGGAILFNAFGSLLEVALIWGTGVAIAIFSVRNMCPAHLNPAVSLAMSIAGRLPWKKLPIYAFYQLLGAMSAALLLYFIFQDSIAWYEAQHEIERGSAASSHVAAMFGEFFPNPGFAQAAVVSLPKAIFMEALGTFLLVFVIFRITEKREQNDNLVPVMIGLTVTLIICVVAPFTQAGLNPARDFGPRVVSYFAGWGNAALPAVAGSFFTVYILGPLAGGALAALIGKWISTPLDPHNSA